MKNIKGIYGKTTTKQRLKKEKVALPKTRRKTMVKQRLEEEEAALSTSPRIHPYSRTPEEKSMIRPRGNGWESYATFNPAAVYESGKVHLIYRAVGDKNRSVWGYASSKDGLHIDEKLDEPIFALEDAEDDPSKEGVKEVINLNYSSGGGCYGGCEDPRITKINGRFYIPFVYFDGRTPPRVALTSINTGDFLNKKWNWKEPVFISPPGVTDKNPAILPEKINGKYVIFHRIFPSILIDFVDDLDFDGKTKWLKGDFSINPREGRWDSRKIGVGPTPIKTKDGWLVIYHGVGDKCLHYKYKVGAMLLDLNDPPRVLYRTKNSILEPEEDDCNITYPCGAVVINDKLFVYYGSRDLTVKVATANLDEFLDAVKDTKEAKVKPTEVFKI